MFVDIFYFRTNREMPKMNPPLHYENKALGLYINP